MHRFRGRISQRTRQCRSPTVKSANRPHSRHSRRHAAARAPNGRRRGGVGSAHRARRARRRRGERLRAELARPPRPRECPARGHPRPIPAVPARVVRSLWERGAPEPRIERWSGRIDVVHALNYVAPPSRAPVVILIHDLSFMKFPELCTPDTLRYPTLIEHALARGATVHTHSEFIAAEVRARSTCRSNGSCRSTRGSRRSAPGSPPKAPASRADRGTCSRSARSSRGRTSPDSSTRSVPSRARTPTFGSWSPGPTVGTAVGSRPRSPRRRPATASSGSGT